MTMAQSPDLQVAGWYTETVLEVRHWTDTLFSFRTTRNPHLRFKSGQFLMLGQLRDGKPLTRAYSIASPAWADELEFLSIKVPDGPLTSRLQYLQAGDPLLIGRKPTGSLILDNLRPGRRLILVATGTGLAPFLSIVREPDYYAAFESIVLLHGVRYERELAYRDYLNRELPHHEYLGEQVASQLLYYPMVTREPFAHPGRVTTLLQGGEFSARLGLPALDPASDRIMICGSPAMLKDSVALVEALGFGEGTSNQPGEYVIERAFCQLPSRPVKA